MSDNKKSHPGLSKAPAPITPLRGTGFTPYGITTRQPPKPPPEPDWEFWLHMPEVKLWQAVALSMNIDPDSLKSHPQAWMSGSDSLIFKEGSFSSAQGEAFHKRLRLLVANKKVKNGFSPGTLSMETPHNHGVRLSECFAWALSIGWDLPPVLIAMARKQAEMTGAPAPKIVTAEKPEAVPVATPLADVEHAHDETLAALFDPVPVEALEKMFPTHSDPSMGKWKNWVEKAASNGLKIARTERAKFNPYKAGVWFLRQGIEGWDIARLNRTLVKNLPARSHDDAHLLTVGID